MALVIHSLEATNKWMWICHFLSNVSSMRTDFGYNFCLYFRYEWLGTSRRVHTSFLLFPPPPSPLPQTIRIRSKFSLLSSLRFSSSALQRVGMGELEPRYQLWDCLFVGKLDSNIRCVKTINSRRHKGGGSQFFVPLSFRLWQWQTRRHIIHLHSRTVIAIMNLWKRRVLC